MKDVFNKMKEEGEIMCQALREFFAKGNSFKYCS